MVGNIKQRSSDDGVLQSACDLEAECTIEDVARQFVTSGPNSYFSYITTK